MLFYKVGVRIDVSKVQSMMVLGWISYKDDRDGEGFILGFNDLD